MNIDALGLVPVTATGEVPLYRQVKRELLRSIETGRCGPGKVLPNETVLAAALEVSVGTLRRATDELVHEHVLVRRQGKGTTVATHTHDRFLFHFFHVEPRPDPLDSDRMPVSHYPVVECMGFDKDKATLIEAAVLWIRAGDPVYRIDNRLKLDGHLVAHDHIVISSVLFKGLTEKRLLDRPSTIYALYQSEFGITVLRAQERARAAGTTRHTARMLGLPVGTPAIEVHRVALTFGDKPVEYRVSTVNTQHHDYVSLLSKRL